jgi:hypothetical protein
MRLNGRNFVQTFFALYKTQLGLCILQQTTADEENLNC